MKHFKVFLITLILLVIVAGTANAERFGVYTVNAPSGLNVRSGPGRDYRINLLLSDRAEVVVLDTREDWGLVIFRTSIGKREPMGWVCMDYLVERYDIEVDLDGYQD